MSLYINNCEEQNIGFWTLLSLLIHEGADGSKYLNVYDSGYNTDELLLLHCNEYVPIISLIGQTIIEDNDGLPAINFVSSNGIPLCPNKLDFEYKCDSQYLIIL